TFWASPLIVPGAPPRDGISSITSSNWTTASPRRSGATLPDSGTVRRTVGGVVGAGRRAGRPGWRRRPRRPGRSGAAERPELVGQRLPLISPRPLLFALLGDHLGGRPGDEILV